MSCAYRTHRYRASVTARPTSVSWQHVTGHAQHPIPLRPLVVYPHRQAVLATADDAPIPVSLVQYLWSRWQESPPDVRDAVTAVIGALMRSPRWRWDVTVLPDQSLPDPQHPFVSERDGRPTIGMPIAMLRALWMWVLHDPGGRISIVRWWVSSIDPPLWEELHALQQKHAPWMSADDWGDLYGYLSPRRLPQMTHEIRRLLRSDDPDDRYTALTALTRWLESPDHETRTVATQMLHESTHVIAAIVRDFPSDTPIDWLVPTILTATRPEDRVAWVATLWESVTDPTLDEWRRQMIADALKRMIIHDPMAAALVRARLRTVPLTHPAFSAPVWQILLEGLMHTAVAGEVLEEVLDAIAQAIREDRHTIPQLEPVLAACWGTGHDQRILEIITSNPSPWWAAVLAGGITTSSMEAEVYAIIQSQVPRDRVFDLIVHHIHDREGREDWPLAPLPAHLIPWVCAAARNRPSHLHPTTIRRLWLTNPDDAWNVTQTMLHSDDSSVQRCAIAAMDAGWGTGHDEIITQTLRLTILDHQSDPSVAGTGIATAVAGIGIAPPSLIATLLTELVMKGNEIVQRDLISALRHGWGRGQDALVMRVVAIIAEREDSSEWMWIWNSCHDTLVPAWSHLPSHVVVSLIDRLVTRAMIGLANEANFEKSVWMESMAEHAIAAFAPGWIHLPTQQVIERIAHHVAHLHAHAHTVGTYSRDTLVSAWAAVVTAGMERLSASDFHTLLAPLWDLSPHGCVKGVVRWVRGVRWFR